MSDQPASDDRNDPESDSGTGEAFEPQPAPRADALPEPGTLAGDSARSIPEGRRWKMLFFAGLAVGAAAYGWNMWESVRANRAFSEGVAAYQAGQFPQAVTHFTRAIEYSPRFDMAYANRAGAEINLNQLDAALADCEQAIALNERLSGAWSNRAAIHMHRRQYAEAMRDLNQALTLDPTSSFAWSTRSSAQYRLGKFAEAIEDATEALRHCSDDGGRAALYSLRGTAHLELKDFERAISEYNEALRLRPRHGDDLVNRGLALQALGRLGEAMADFSAAIEADSTRADYYRFRSHARLDQKDYAGAVADVGEVLRLKPDDVSARLVRAAALLSLGQFTAVVDDCNEVLRHDAAQVSAYLYRGDARINLGEPAQAADDYGMAIGIAGDNPRAWFGRGVARLMQNQLDTAIEDFTRAIELDPKFAAAYFNRSRAYGRLGDDERSRADLEKAIELDPGLRPKPQIESAGSLGRPREQYRDLRRARPPLAGHHG